MNSPNQKSFVKYYNQTGLCLTFKFTWFSFALVESQGLGTSLSKNSYITYFSLCERSKFYFHFVSTYNCPNINLPTEWDGTYMTLLWHCFIVWRHTLIARFIETLHKEFGLNSINHYISNIHLRFGVASPSLSSVAEKNLSSPDLVFTAWVWN